MRTFRWATVKSTDRYKKIILDLLDGFPLVAALASFAAGLWLSSVLFKTKSLQYNASFYLDPSVYLAVSLFVTACLMIYHFRHRLSH